MAVTSDSSFLEVAMLVHTQSFAAKRKTNYVAKNITRNRTLLPYK